jgi:hypothetical protein
MERAPEHRPQVLHTLVVSAAWVLFVWFWIQVIDRTPVGTMIVSAVIVGVSLTTTVALTSLWIYHNLRIFRKKGPRRSVPPVTAEYRSDFLGRRLTAEWGELQRAALIRISAGPGIKVYQAPDGPDTARY